MAIIDYNEQRAFAMSLDIVDIGNTVLRASTVDGIEYYVVTKAVDGKMSIIKFGPVLADAQMLLDGFSVTYKKTDYKEGSLVKDISQYVNDGRKKIVLVEEITEYEAFECFPEIATCFNEL